MNVLSARDRDGTEPDWQFFTLAIVMTTIALVFVLSRLAVRWRQPGLHVEDWLIVAAMALGIVASVFDCISVTKGNGMHNDLLTYEELTTASKYYYIATLPYKPAIGLTKLSILVLYYRVFVHPTFQKIDIGLIIYVTLFTIATSVATIFQCTPVPRAWDKSIPGTCVQPTAQWYAFAAFNLTAELTMFFLPMPMIKRLQLPKLQKIGLFMIFCVGFFVIFCTVMRLIIIGIQTNNQDNNYTWSGGNHWTVIEVNVGFICACIPTMKGPFIKLLHVFGIKAGLTNSSRGPSYVMSSRELSSNRHSVRLSKRDQHSKKGFSQFDQISEEDFLPNTDDGILKTTTIGVAFDTESRHSTISDDVKEQHLDGRKPA